MKLAVLEWGEEETPFFYRTYEELVDKIQESPASERVSREETMALLTDDETYTIDNLVYFRIVDVEVPNTEFAAHVIGFLRDMLVAAMEGDTSLLDRQNSALDAGVVAIDNLMGYDWAEKEGIL